MAPNDSPLEHCCTARTALLMAMHRIIIQTLVIGDSDWRYMKFEAAKIISTGQVKLYMCSVESVTGFW